jgi:putative transposase
LEEHRQCILVVMGATLDGKKELIAIKDGVRESEQSWHEIFVELRQRGLKEAPKLAVGDGALGFWAALRKDWPETIEQRCWVHKTANVLNKVPKSIQGLMKSALHEIFKAATAKEADKAFDSFVLKFQAKYPKATQCLSKDRSVLLSFYSFPAEHCLHVRSTNVIESVFATVRLRHRRTKGSGTARACLAMVFKLCESASRRWKKLNGYQLVFHVSNGARLKDGERLAA